MNRFLLSVIGAATVLTLMSARVHADMITYRYDWSQSTSFVAAGGAGTGGINIANVPPNSTASGSGAIVAASVTTISSAPASQPDMFNGQSYTMTVVLTDLASGQSGKLSWVGHLFGTLTANSGTITSTFSSPTAEQIKLGNNLYNLTIGPFLGLNYTAANGSSVSVASTTGSIDAQVNVSPFSSGGGGGGTGGGGGGHTANNTPEPSSLILASLGLCGLYGLRRARRLPVAS